MTHNIFITFYISYIKNANKMLKKTNMLKKSYKTYQADFRANKSTTDLIFILKEI